MTRIQIFNPGRAGEMCRYALRQVFTGFGQRGFRESWQPFNAKNAAVVSAVNFVRSASRQFQQRQSTPALSR